MLFSHVVPSQISAHRRKNPKLHHHAEPPRSLNCVTFTLHVSLSPVCVCARLCLCNWLAGLIGSASTAPFSSPPTSQLRAECTQYSPHSLQSQQVRFEDYNAELKKNSKVHICKI